MKKLLIRNLGNTGYQSFVNGSARGFGFFASAGFTMFISRYFTLGEMGIFAILGVVFAVINTFINLGLGTAIIRLVPEYLVKGKSRDIDSLVSTFIGIPLILLFLVLALCFFFQKSLSLILLKSDSLGFYVILSVIYSCFNFYSDSVLLIYQGLGDFKKVSQFYLFGIFSQRVLALVLIFLGFSLRGLFFGFILGSVATASMGLYSLRKYIKAECISMSLINYAFPYYAQGLSRFGFMQIDQLLVALSFNREILGGYYIAKRIADIFQMMYFAVRDPIGNRLIQQIAKSKALYDKFLKKSALYSIVLSLSVNLSLVMFSKPVLRFLAGSQYEHFQRVLIFAAFVNISISLYGIVNTDLFIRLRPGKYLLSQILLLALSLCGQLGLGKWYGYNGFQAGQISGYISWILLVILYYSLRNAIGRAMRWKSC